MKWITVSILALAPWQAQANNAHQSAVLSCLGEVGFSTEWNTRLNLMFEPCAGEEIGSDAHLACLFQQRVDWHNTKIRTEAVILERLTEGGVEELSGLMLAWPSFVKNKCEVVGESRADISYEAARLGCEVSEHVLLTNEFQACLDGRSTEDYCKLKDY